MQLNRKAKLRDINTALLRKQPLKPTLISWDVLVLLSIAIEILGSKYLILMLNICELIKVEVKSVLRIISAHIVRSPHSGKLKILIE